MAVGLGILLLFLRRVNGGLLFGSATLVIDADVAEFYIFNIMTRNAHNQRSVAAIGVVDHDIADVHAAQ